MSKIVSPDKAFDRLQSDSLYRAALTALDILHEKGYQAFIVGGFVRDALLGRSIHDADLTCNAPYEDLIALFSEKGFAAHRTGEKHGTATVIVDGFPLEITRYRADGASRDHRHPEKISFVETIEEDLARRDFTINALAFSPDSGLVDPFGGIRDLEKGVVRCVGCPQKRFDEDALRIVRALRFASQLGFSLEEKTAEAVHGCAPLLHNIARERIFKEFTLLLCGKDPYTFLMDYHDVVIGLFPDFKASWGFDQHTPYHIYSVYDHIAHCVQAIAATPLDRWVAFLHDVGKPAAWAPDETGRGHFPGHAKISAEVARRVARTYRMPRSFADDLILLVLRHDDMVEETPRAVKRMMRKLGGSPELFLHLSAMKRADTLSQAPQCAGRLKMVAHLEEILAEVLEQDAIFQTRDLAVGGKDLIAAGYTPGPAFRELLDAALDAVVDERIGNSSGEIWGFWEKEGYLEKIKAAP